MMETLSKQYEDLLIYFESQKLKPKKEKELKKLDDSKIHSYIPNPIDTDPNALSSGFSIKRFEDMMRTKLIEEHKKLQSYERPYISVSELLGCLRQVYYNRLRYNVDLNKLYNFSYLYMIQKVGDTIHNVIQQLYGFSEIEKPIISDKFKVKGRADAISNNYLYEIKSKDNIQFSKEHFYQGNMYAYILNTEYQYKIEYITIIYVHRNLKTISPVDMPIDYAIAESHLKKAILLKSAIDNRKIIDSYGSTNETCKYCLYKAQCGKDKKAIKTKKDNDENDDRTAFLL